jgi:hypothetical protein
MTNKFGWSRYLAYLVISLALIGCNSTKNRTEERAKERVIQFIHLMSANKIEEAEKLLTRQLREGENMELFIESFDDWELKDTSIVITVEEVSFYRPDDKNKAIVSFTVRNDKVDFTKMTSMPIKYEKGDWYLGG